MAEVSGLTVYGLNLNTGHWDSHQQECTVRLLEHTRSHGSWCIMAAGTLGHAVNGYMNTDGVP
jgi:hypothetical protein